ncbi:hypothetical protein VNO78_20776 [Psophocarpus tetragonolobus]|uniref:Glutaredoxin n=1 Tax=Psophocarpus tetragonolobus TaxID=3891 RepID=A0AAN9SAF0_PSOTE
MKQLIYNPSKDHSFHISRAHVAIRSFGANPTVYELDEMPNGQQIERALLQMGCQPSVPSVLIGQQFIGGSKRVMSLHLRNQLVPLLINARAIWI